MIILFGKKHDVANGMVRGDIDAWEGQQFWEQHVRVSEDTSAQQERKQTKTDNEMKHKCKHKRNARLHEGGGGAV